MTTTDTKKKKLLDFLDEKVFDPVLKKSKDDFSGEKTREKFQDVKKSTKNEKDRFHNKCSSNLHSIRDNFMQDLHSSAARRIHKELKELGLPAPPDYRDEFLKLCEELEV